MIIKIDVPDTTFATSVTVIYKGDCTDVMASRCFKVTKGAVEDEFQDNKVVVAKKEEHACTQD